MYMTDNSFEKYSTKYKQVATFYIVKERAEKIFEQLTDNNKITLNIFGVSTRYVAKVHDKIYIRALYYMENETYKLLVCNDARRRIVNLYKLRKFEKDFETRFIHKLSKRFNNCTEFMKFYYEVLKVNSGQFFISGSFPLQVYLDEDWPESDLDIYLTCSPGESAIQHYLSQNYVRHKLTSTSDKSEYDASEVWEYKTNSGFRIQTIEVPRLSMDRVLRDFDLDFCKIAFYYYQDAPHVNIHNEQAIRNRTGTYNVKKNVKRKCRERLTKYEKRGFTITNAAEVLKNEN